MDTPVIPVDLLKTGASEFGLELTDAQIARLTRFVELLLEWNAKFNLTRITDPAEVVTKHLLDSLSPLSAVEFPANAKVLDIGTGAGMPGIPLKIVRPDLEMTLFDATRKKLTFIDAVIDDLGLTKASTLHGRAEDKAHDPAMRGSYDVVTARAVSDMRALAEYTLPYAKVKGIAVAMKGPDIEQELSSASKAISTLGGKVEKVEKLTLPHSDASRTLVVIRKISPTPAKYPRRQSEISAKPL